MRFETRTLFDQQINVTANLGRTVSIALPRVKFIRNIILRLSGTFNYTAGGTFPTMTPTDDTPMGLIRRIRVIRDGGETLKNLSFTHAFYMDCLERGTIPERRPLTAGDETNVSMPFTAVCYLDFQLNPRNREEGILIDPNTNIPVCALLPAHTFSSLTLSVDIGIATDLVAETTGTPTFTITDAVLDTTIVEAFTEDTDPELGEENFIEVRESEIELEPIVTTPEAPLNLTVGNLYRRVTLIGYAGAVRNNDVITRYRVMQNSPFNWEIMNVDWRTSQAKDKEEYGVETLEANFPFLRGLTVIDFDRDRTLAHAIDTTNMKAGDIRLLLSTVAGAGRKIVALESMVY